MTLEKFLHTLAMTESNNNADVELGDGGRALGRFQVHPDWVFTQSKKFKKEPNLNETWDSFITRLVSAFFNQFQLLRPVYIAMHFHLGHASFEWSDDWDKEYAARFLKFSGN